MHRRLVRRPNESPHLCLQIDIRLASAFHERLAESSAVFFGFVTGVSEALQLSIPEMSDHWGTATAYFLKLTIRWISPMAGLVSGSLFLLAAGENPAYVKNLSLTSNLLPSSETNDGEG